MKGSVQLDGGLLSVTKKILQRMAPSKNKREMWSRQLLPVLSSGITLGILRIGSSGDKGDAGDEQKNRDNDNVAATIASSLLHACLCNGVHVIVPTSSGLYDNAHFLDTVLEIKTNDAGLAFGQVRNFSLFWTILFFVLNDL
jgi:hypothetical protein